MKFTQLMYFIVIIREMVAVMEFIKERKGLFKKTHGRGKAKKLMFSSGDIM